MPVSGKWRIDIALIATLLVLAGGIKGWLLAHTEVLSRDGIGYILYASRLEREPWPQVLSSVQQHPLYPINVLLMSRAVQVARGPLEVLDWQLAAQLANVLAGVLLVVPMYLLGRELFDRRVGFWTALVFQVMPVSARATADALSEGTYLLFAATGLWLAASGLRTRQWGLFILAGLTGGLAYLTRPEGALVVGVAGLVLIALQVIRRERSGWGKTLACACCLGVGSLLVVGPYCWTIGGLTVKPSSLKIFNAEGEGGPEITGAAWPLFASRFSPGTEDAARTGDGSWAAVHEVLDELNQGFHYIGWAPALFGLWWFRRRFFEQPALWLLLLVAALQLAAISRLAVTLNYVSQRHTLIIVLCGLYLGIAALLDWARKRDEQVESAPASPNVRFRRASGIVLCFLLAFTMWGTLRSLRPLHAHRIGHREAGFWLAEHADPRDDVVDPYGWVKFYSGRVLRRAGAGPAAAGATYLVVDPADGDLHRLRAIQSASLPDARRAVYVWPKDKPPRVVIYRVEKPHQTLAGSNR